MTKLYLLTDYKGQFGYKYLAKPYLSGFDAAVLRRALEERGFEPHFMPLADIDFRSTNLRGEYVVYTSSQDDDLHYKSFIEDIVLGLQLQGARLVPRFELLRAHHNKVFMEILRELVGGDEARSPRARYFGSIEELLASESRLDKPAVVKPAAGAMSAGVVLARDTEQLIRAARAVSQTMRLRPRVHELVRALRRKGYVPESQHRRKFVVQDFVAGVDHDWKILVYGDKLYAIHRRTRSADFRASGSGRLSFPREAPTTLLDLSSKLARSLDVPWLSVDAVVANGTAQLFEFQVLHFGTAAIQQSAGYFVQRHGRWQFDEARSVVEEEYAEALAQHLKRATSSES